jgi:uncharacterized membrane protein YeiH
MALESGEGALVVALIGVVTAGVGGIIRDLLISKSPQAIFEHEFYLVIALAGGLIISLFGFLEMPIAWAAILAAMLVTVGRMLAISKGWRLPAILP